MVHNYHFVSVEPNRRLFWANRTEPVRFAKYYLMYFFLGYIFQPAAAYMIGSKLKERDEQLLEIFFVKFEIFKFCQTTKESAACCRHIGVFIGFIVALIRVRRNIFFSYLFFLENSKNFLNFLTSSNTFYEFLGFLELSKNFLDFHLFFFNFLHFVKFSRAF